MSVRSEIFMLFDSCSNLHFDEIILGVFEDRNWSDCVPSFSFILVPHADSYNHCRICTFRSDKTCTSVAFLWEIQSENPILVLLVLPLLSSLWRRPWLIQLWNEAIDGLENLELELAEISQESSQFPYLTVCNHLET
jgi:hypothetical protein